MYLYCISNTQGQCKFGFSGEPLKRLRALQTGSSDELFLIESIRVDGSRVRELERELHKEIGAYRKCRGEWFNVAAEEGAAILQWFGIHHAL
jgi:hypothetical protein